MGMGFFLSVIKYGMQVKQVATRENVYCMDVVEGKAKVLLGILADRCIQCWAFPMATPTNIVDILD